MIPIISPLVASEIVDVTATNGATVTTNLTSSRFSKMLMCNFEWQIRLVQSQDMRFWSNILAGAFSIVIINGGIRFRQF